MRCYPAIPCQATPVSVLASKFEKGAGLALIIVSAGIALSLWIVLVSFVFTSPIKSGLVGGDLEMFRTAAVLADEGNWETLYSPVYFAEAYERTSGSPTPPGAAIIAYPPTTVALFSLLAGLSYPGLYVFWYGACITVVIAVLTALRTPLALSLLFLLSTPFYALVRLGQTTWLAVGILGMAAVLLRKERPIAAGAVLGMLAFKPPLIIGIIVWSLLSRNARKIGISAAVTGLIWFGISVLTLPDAWFAYLINLPALARPSTIVSSFDYSFLGFISSLSGNRTALTAFLSAALLVTVLTWASLHFKGPDETLCVGLAGAIFLTVLVSPHLVVYDWAILFVAIALLWPPVQIVNPERSLLAGGLIAVGALAGYAPIRVLGLEITLAYPILLIAAWLLLRLANPNCISRRDATPYPSST